MLKRTLIAASSLAALATLSAGPAAAYPTAIWNVPTGKVTAPGNLHIGVYTYATPTRATSIQDALTFGALPGLDLGGVSGVGALELGIDTYGVSEVFNGKLQLFGEGDLLPALSVGGLNLFNTTGPSENIVYGSLTKELALGDVSLGSWTLGYFNTMPGDGSAAQNGVMGGVFYPLGDRAGVAVDHMTGATSVSGTNAYLTYGVASNAYVSVGHYFHHSDPSLNLTFIGVDLDLATGLFGQ